MSNFMHNSLTNPFKFYILIFKERGFDYMPTKNYSISLLVYMYISLPFFIFASGFMKGVFSVIATLVIGSSIFLAAKASNGLYAFPFEKKSCLKLLLGLLIITAIVLLSGIGNIMWQNNDHATRNTIFEILAEYSWPPKYSDEGPGLIYYIGFWLPSALVAKLTSLSFGYIFQVIWAVIGIFILWYLICLVHKKIVLYPLIIFMFFSGLDIVGRTIVFNTVDKLNALQIGTWAFSKGSELTSHIEWWPSWFQYSSHITQLFWVFNQSIPVWIATLLVLVERTNKNLVFIMGVTLLSSTLPFIGLIPIFAWCVLTNHDGDMLSRPFTDDFKKSFLSLFTFQNVFGGGVSGIMSFLYLRGNTASQITSAQTAETAKTATSNPSFSLPVFLLIIAIWIIAFVLLSDSLQWKKVYVFYLLPALPVAFMTARLPNFKLAYYFYFIILEVLVYFLLTLSVYKSSSLYFIVLCSMLLVPFFTVGKSIDFCMRASIPLIVLLCLFVTTSLASYIKNQKKVLAMLLCLVLLIGAVTPFMEIMRTIEATEYNLEKYGAVWNDIKTERQVFGGKNFSGKIEGNIFFEVFAN